MKGNFYTLFYAAALGIVCSLLLTAVGSITKPYKDANAKAEEVLNILTALNVPFSPDASSEELVKIFNAKIREQVISGKEVYVYSSSGDSKKIDAVAIAFSGPGLWGPIKGFLALESDMKTIRGITFHEQEETPGLGGEIAAPWFRKQFKGKKIVSDSGKPGIVIGGADVQGVNHVDGITGATMTCDKVEAMLNSAISEIISGLEENKSKVIGAKVDG